MTFLAIPAHRNICSSYAPFPGFTMEIKAPIVSLLYDLNQFSVPAGELSATIGISSS